MAPTRRAILGGGGTHSRALMPKNSKLVVMKTLVVSCYYLFDRVSFRNTTFQPGFVKSLEKKTCVPWLGNANGFDIFGDLPCIYHHDPDIILHIRWISAIVFPFEPFALKKNVLEFAMDNYPTSKYLVAHPYSLD